ncbi:hypothetical protein Q4F19_14415 [Sphingomonas sp. BIUV-7]|uniref:Antitoxin Xre/MbcA/ParS-like toxin-binding domain-containing protein n=1 Tax=Sphingomonas natans TaxID=3063330 RepID=A0ABT8YB82_9SPHN|nr:hypothetical protein [Sphingomonas sp. BIUV-7]MDO6415580.1 hypothetical protein [Sphingomonas sp. BIUV-7]
MSGNFRRKAIGRQLTSEEATRQGRVSRLAFEAMKEPGAAVAFLNAEDSALGGRPIDLAVASAEGLLSVEQAIATYQAR